MSDSALVAAVVGFLSARGGAFTILGAPENFKPWEKPDEPEDIR